MIPLSELKFQEEESLITNTFFNSKTLRQNGFDQTQKNDPSYRRLKAGSAKSVNYNRVAWADQINAKPRRIIRSVGKSSVKKANIENVGSVDLKKKREKLNLRTEVEESIHNEQVITSEILKFAEIGKQKRASEKSKLKKVTNDFLKTKEDKIAKFLSLASGNQTFKIGSENEIGGPKNDDFFFQKLANSSSEFYKKNLKDLNRRIFSKQVEPEVQIEKDKNSFSKISTNVQEESKQTPNDSENSPLQQSTFMITNLKNVKQMSTQINSFKEKNNNDIFVEIQKNSRTAYQKDEFYKPSDFYKELKKVEHPITSIISDKNVVEDKCFRPGSFKLNDKEQSAKMEDRKKDVLIKPKEFESYRFLRTPEEEVLAVQLKSIEKNETQKGKLVLNTNARPCSAPLKDEQKDQLIQKHLFFDARNKNDFMSKFVGNSGGIQMFIPKIQKGVGKEKTPSFKSKLMKLS